ncbi:MAG: hypothetical protein EPO52_06050 [Herbiconiux sp.]|uniref:cohesin domain-containing protein n=1 Tax=Herbiconiux sp. TaxID=1871186 RepID=UPI0011FA2FC9|nr:cohesin domain-containing protein [Herbiconiux sp.]TAJ48924.1 MAG: hypothetical protein EPO52_06050 [Herbiconiux sp.]
MHTTPTRRRRIRAAVLAGGLAVGLSLLGGAGAAVAAPAATSVTLTATPDVAPGAVVDVAVGLVATSDVFAYEIELQFDPALLAYVPDSVTGPDGGFISATTAPGSMTLLQTRLGTSPALSGDLAATAQFTSLAPGDAVITASVTLVDGDGATTVLADEPTAPVTITAPPVTEPEPTAEPTATPAPTSAAPTATSTPAAVAVSDGNLALTGFGVGGLILFAVVAVAIGLVVVLRRRAASAR